jgi:hypothetical protein
MALKGDLVSAVPYTRFKTIANGDTFGPFATPPSEALDAIYVSAAGSLVVVGSDGVSVTFTTIAAGTVLPISPTAVTTVPGAGTIGLYR